MPASRVLATDPAQIAGSAGDSLGDVCFVFHSHLPWVLGHGTWPVGEEWLYQAYAHSYIPLLTELAELEREGFRNLASLGITPVLAAQLDNSIALRNLDIWLNNWQLRAGEVPSNHPAFEHERALAQKTRLNFLQYFSRGASPMIRRLHDSGAVEILGGPLAHPFTPNLTPEIHDIALATGLDDAARRWGFTPNGIWVPECAYRPHQEGSYEMFGITHFLIDEPAIRAVHGEPNVAYQLGDSSVNVVARDAHASDHLWSAQRGFPGNENYRDFHDVDAAHGVRLSRVGNKADADKEPYVPERATIQVRSDADTFIDSLVNAFDQQRSNNPHKRPRIVVGIDTELLGHWWHEGVSWFSTVIRSLPSRNISTITLQQASSNPRASVQLGASSWGEGKDWRIWTDDPVRDLVIMNHQAQGHVLAKITSDIDTRDPELNSDLNELMLLLSSDWAFMISRDSAAQYARERAIGHFQNLMNSKLLDATERPFPMVETIARAQFRMQSDERAGN